jgi:hypothetical protein
MAREHQPTERYLQLMNERYDVIRKYAHDGTLAIYYDGESWTAQVAVGPERTFGRWKVGEGLTLELAVVALERELGIPRWSG